MDLRHAMADHRQIEGFRHAGDLEPWRDAAGAHLIDHHDIDRAGLEHVAEWHDAPEVFAACNRRRERLGHPREPRVIVMRGHVLEPIEATPASSTRFPMSIACSTRQRWLMSHIKSMSGPTASRISPACSTSRAGEVTPGRPSCIFAWR